MESAILGRPTRDPWAKASCLRVNDQLLYLSSFYGKMSFERDKLVPLIASIDDWDRVLDKALYHRLLPRLYFFLKSIGVRSLLNPEVWERIETRHLAAQAHVLALEGELQLLLPSFEASRVEVLLLKGAALARILYPDKPLRFFADLDLMIHKEDLPKAEKILAESGYRKTTRSRFPSRWHDQEVGSRLFHNAFSWTHPEKSVEIDLHIEPFDDSLPVPLKADWLWEEASSVNIGNFRALMPEPNRLFVFLLFHLAKHIGMDKNYFALYLDLDEYLRTYEGRLDADDCCQRLQESPSPENMLKILAFLELHFRTPLLPEFKDLIEEKTIDPLPLETIFPPSEESEIARFNDNSWLDRREHFTRLLGEVPGFLNKSIFLLRWIFPDREYLRQKYPFKGLPEKLSAYVKHFGAILGKGVALGAYWMRGYVRK